MYHKYTRNNESMPTECLINLVMLIPEQNLRRKIARDLWFDLCDDRPGDEMMIRLKQLAEINHIDHEIDWTNEDEACALRLVGYNEKLIEVRIKIENWYRHREQTCIAPSEYCRLIEKNGELRKYNTVAKRFVVLRKTKVGKTRVRYDADTHSDSTEQQP